MSTSSPDSKYRFFNLAAFPPRDLNRMMNFCYYWLPPLVLTASILCMAGDMGSVIRFRFPVRILAYLLPSFSRHEVIELYLWLRKVGHFLAYALLFGVYVRAWRWHLHLSRSKAILLSLGICLVIAIADESRQAMFSSRSGNPWDVVLDFGSALTAALLLFPRLGKDHGEAG